MQERRIDDFWNIDGSRDLSDSWTGFTQFTLLEEKPPEGFMWSGIYFIDPEDEEFKETIKNARKKLETSVAPAMPCNEKPKLDNVRKLRGIYFIDPEVQRNH